IESIDWIEANPQQASEIIGEVYEYEKDEAWELWQKSGIQWNPTFGLYVLETQAAIISHTTKMAKAKNSLEKKGGMWKVFI
ncbi:unnamed protein product, partial [marine sediment metagenome]